MRFLLSTLSLYSSHQLLFLWLDMKKLVTTIFAIWSASLILSKMLYQLSVASYFKHEDNCTYVYFAPAPDTPDYAPFNNQSALDYRTYLGFEEVPDIFPYIGKYLLILLVLTVNSVVTLRQRIHRQRFGLQSNPSKLLFMDGSRKNADQGLWQSIKFLLNYSFYKFGIEITIFVNHCVDRIKNGCHVLRLFLLVVPPVVASKENSPVSLAILYSVCNNHCSHSIPHVFGNSFCSLYRISLV